ncbi:MAG: DUF4303 domain-containing protein [Pseudomonadota bacterium]
MTAAIASGTETIWNHARERYSSEKIYAFVLTTWSDASSIGASVGTVENYDRLYKEHRYSIPNSRAAAGLKWGWNEWHERELISGASGFHDADQLLDQFRNGASGAPRSLTDQFRPWFSDYRKLVTSAMYDALKLVARTGLFETCSSMPVLVYLGVYDDDGKITLNSAKTLNSKATWNLYEAEFRRAFGF